MSQKTRHRGVADDDVVETLADASGNARPPLVVLEPLERFLDDHGIGTGPISVSAIGDGHSNVTFLLERGDERVVLRRPPRPPIQPSAHDVLREARVLSALQGQIAVPRVLATGEDTGIIGAPFYVMSHVGGAVVGRTVPDTLDTEPDRRAMADGLVDTLVAIHDVDWRAAGLERFGRPDGYLERQVRRFTGLWQSYKTREVPAVEHVATWLADNLPSSGPASIVHGDYRLGNVMFAPGRSPGKATLTAVLDWEMSTIGDPLADLGYLSICWIDPEDPPSRFDLSDATRQSGFPTRDEIIELYAQRSGRTVDHLDWYQALAYWKSAVFMEGNYARAAAGISDDAYAREFADGVRFFAEQAAGFTRS
jgi:aminoglycoside phosphotransferase (APT) family kinase protein